MRNCALKQDWQFTSAIRGVRGSVAPTRTQMACCANTSPRAPISIDTVKVNSTLWQQRAMGDRARPWDGVRLLRHLRTYYSHLLRRLLEPKLTAAIGVHEQ